MVPKFSGRDEVPFLSLLQEASKGNNRSRETERREERVERLNFFIIMLIIEASQRGWQGLDRGERKPPAERLPMLAEGKKAPQAIVQIRKTMQN